MQHFQHAKKLNEHKKKIFSPESISMNGRSVEIISSGEKFNESRQFEFFFVQSKIIFNFYFRQRMEFCYCTSYPITFLVFACIKLFLQVY